MTELRIIPLPLDCDSSPRFLIEEDALTADDIAALIACRPGGIVEVAHPESITFLPQNTEPLDRIAGMISDEDLL